MSSIAPTTNQDQGFLNQTIRDLALVAILISALVTLAILLDNDIQVPPSFCQLMTNHIDNSIDPSPQVIYEALTNQERHNLLVGCGYNGPRPRPAAVQ